MLKSMHEERKLALKDGIFQSFVFNILWVVKTTYGKCVFSFILHAGCPGDLDKDREINFKYLDSEVTVECNQRQIHRETIPYPQNLFIKISQDIIGIHSNCFRSK